MVEQTYDFKPLLQYLRDTTYRGVPPALFDRYLWLYSDLELLQYAMVHGKNSAEQIGVYKLQEHTGIKAMALLRYNDKVLRMSADSIREDFIEQLIEHVLAEHKPDSLSLTLCNYEIAAQIAQAHGSSLVPGSAKYYTSSTIGAPSFPVREMLLHDEPYIAAIQPRRWPAYAVFLRNGVRYFGLVHDGRLRAMCGLTQLTCFSAQVIGVETFDPSDYRKGYAKAVCTLAINESLAQSPIVTWSTSLPNIASCRTAESLGMKAYYGLYEIIDIKYP